MQGINLIKNKTTARPVDREFSNFERPKDWNSTFYENEIKLEEIQGKRKNTGNTLLSGVELGKLVCKYLLTEYTTHPNHLNNDLSPSTPRIKEIAFLTETLHWNPNKTGTQVKTTFV